MALCVAPSQSGSVCNRLSHARIAVVEARKELAQLVGFQDVPFTLIHVQPTIVVALLELNLSSAGSTLEASSATQDLYLLEQVCLCRVHRIAVPPCHPLTLEIHPDIDHDVRWDQVCQ